MPLGGEGQPVFPCPSQVQLPAAGLASQQPACSSLCLPGCWMSHQGTAEGTLGPAASNSASLGLGSPACLWRGGSGPLASGLANCQSNRTAPGGEGQPPSLSGGLELRMSHVPQTQAVRTQAQLDLKQLSAFATTHDSLASFLSLLR